MIFKIYYGDEGRTGDTQIETVDTDFPPFALSSEGPLRLQKGDSRLANINFCAAALLAYFNGMLQARMGNVPRKVNKAETPALDIKAIK